MYNFSSVCAKPVSSTSDYMSTDWSWNVRLEERADLSFSVKLEEQTADTDKQEWVEVAVYDQLYLWHPRCPWANKQRLLASYFTLHFRLFCWSLVSNYGLQMAHCYDKVTGIWIVVYMHFACINIVVFPSRWSEGPSCTEAGELNMSFGSSGLLTFLRFAHNSWIFAWLPFAHWNIIHVAANDELIKIITSSLARSLTHSLLTHYLTHAFSHSFTHSLTHLLT